MAPISDLEKASQHSGCKAQHDCLPPDCPLPHLLSSFLLCPTAFLALPGSHTRLTSRPGSLPLLLPGLLFSPDAGIFCSLTSQSSLTFYLKSEALCDHSISKEVTDHPSSPRIPCAPLISTFSKALNPYVTHFVYCVCSLTRMKEEQRYLSVLFAAVFPASRTMPGT